MTQPEAADSERRQAAQALAVHELAQMSSPAEIPLGISKSAVTNFQERYFILFSGRKAYGYAVDLSFALC